MINIVVSYLRHFINYDTNLIRYHDTIEAYDPVRDVWETAGEMPSSRSWLSCVPLVVSCNILGTFLILMIILKYQ